MAACAAAPGGAPVASASAGFAAELGARQGLAPERVWQGRFRRRPRRNDRLESGASASASRQSAARSFVEQLRGRVRGHDPSDGLRVALPEPHFGRRDLRAPPAGSTADSRFWAVELAVVVVSASRVLSVLGETSPRRGRDSTPRSARATRPKAATVRSPAAIDPADADRCAPRLAAGALRPGASGRAEPVRQGPHVVGARRHLGRRSEPINEFVVVDAANGVVALHFDQIETALNRRICDANEMAAQVPCTAPVRTEGGPRSRTTNDDVNPAYDFSGDTYNFYFNSFGRDSLDDAGLTSNHVDFCPPAGTARTRTRSGTAADGLRRGLRAADDVVGHELTHGVTDFTSHLFYYAHRARSTSRCPTSWASSSISPTVPATTLPRRWQLGRTAGLADGIRNMTNPPTSVIRTG